MPSFVITATSREAEFFVRVGKAFNYLLHMLPLVLKECSNKGSYDVLGL
jgi:hypothetical protein